mgnify:FL=1
MNTIHLKNRYELSPKYYVIPFSCSDIVGINTNLRPAERTDTENRLLGAVWDRITLVLQKHGYEVKMVNFRSMTISAVKI